jgi:chromosome partitioning protein
MLVAAALCSDTFRVAVVDLEPQGSACLWAAVGDGKFPAHVVSATAATLADVLAGLEEFDAVMLDCPPSSIAPETLAALDVATLAVIPCCPSSLDYWATDAMCMAAEHRRPGLPRLVVVNQFTNTNISRQLAAHITKTWPTATARLSLRTTYREAAALGVGVRQHPGRANHDAISEIRALALEILTTALKAA